MVEHVLDPSPHSSSVLAAFVATVSRLDWQCLQDIDVPLRQHLLSVFINDSTLHTRPTSRCDGVPSATLGLHFQDQSSGVAYATGWECPSTSPLTLVQNATTQQTHLATTRWAVGGTGTGPPVIIPFVFSATQSAGLAPSKEMPNLIPDTSSRPADVFLPTWSRGWPAALDVQVISPLRQQTLGKAASTSGHALQVSV